MQTIVHNSLCQHVEIIIVAVTIIIVMSLVTIGLVVFLTF
jgi:hypothetical protein